MTAAAQELIDEIASVRHQQLSPSACRRIRLRVGVTQERLAEALGVARTTLARWEGGHMIPRPAQRQVWYDLLAALEEASKP